MQERKSTLTRVIDTLTGFGRETDRRIANVLEDNAQWELERKLSERNLTTPDQIHQKPDQIETSSSESSSKG